MIVSSQIWLKSDWNIRKWGRSRFSLRRLAMCSGFSHASARRLLDERQPIEGVAIDLIGADKDEP
jgi:hypothetical protein